MSSLEEVLQAIEDESIKESIVGLINDEKERGKSAYSKKDGEVLKYKNALKGLGYDHEKYDSIDAFIDSKKEVEQKVTKSTMTIAELNDKVNSLTDVLNAEREENNRKTEESRVNKLKAELTDRIGNEFIGSSYLIKDLISEGKVDIADTGDIVYRDGDNILPIDLGLEKIKEANSAMLKANIKGGSGDTGGVSPQEPQTVSLMDKIKAQTNLK